MRGASAETRFKKNAEQDDQSEDAQKRCKNPTGKSVPQLARDQQEDYRVRNSQVGSLPRHRANSADQPERGASDEKSRYGQPGEFPDEIQNYETQPLIGQNDSALQEGEHSCLVVQGKLFHTRCHVYLTKGPGDRPPRQNAAIWFGWNFSTASPE